MALSLLALSEDLIVALSLLELSKDQTCDAPTRHPVSGKGVTNLRTINLLTYIILNNYKKKKIIILQNNIIPHQWSDQHIQLCYIQNLSLFSKIYVHHLKINQNIIDWHLLPCWPLLMWDTAPSIPTPINTCGKLYSLLGIHKYGRPL